MHNEIKTAMASLVRQPTAVMRIWLTRTSAVLLVAQFAVASGCGTMGRPLPMWLTNPAAMASPTALTNPATQAAPSVGNQPVSDMQAAPAAVVAAAFHSDPQSAASSVTRVTYDGDCATDTSSYACSDAEHGTGCNCCASSCAPASPASTYRNAQEYIFDGGDQQPAVVIKKDWSALGVDPTDTVIYYETLAGSVCVQPSNRVPIYAPRFGAVRQVSGLQLAMQAAGTERILAPISAERFDETNLAGTMVQPLAPHGEQQVNLIDAFQENYITPPMEQVLPLVRMSSARVPFELVDPRRTGLITTAELAEIQQLIQNAQTWVNPESLAVEISNQAAILVKDTKAAQELLVYELPDGCAMRICKAASHTIANPGDIVSFSIRFDNAGVKPLGNAVIIDSLSPRLNYIEGSQQCSVGVRFSAEPNDVGSMVLRWEIEEPVKPNDGGVISFDCRVR